MKRILLLTDDFNELTFLETLLKKIGFDCLGVQSISQAKEQAMVMIPDMLILADMFKNQSTHQALESIITYRPQMLVVLLKKDPRTPTLHPAEFVNKVIRSPVDPVELIKGICEVGKLNETTLMEKFKKLGLFKGNIIQDPLRVAGKGPSHQDSVRVMGHGEKIQDTQFIKNLDKIKGAQPQDRQKRFHSELKNLSEPKATIVDHKVAMKEMQEFRARENDTEIRAIDGERKDFVRALFKKK